MSHIENFKIHDEDKCFKVEEYLIWYNGLPILNSRQYYNKSILDTLKFGRTYKDREDDYTEVSECGFEIVAPKKDFNTSNMEVKNYKLVEIEDPIVLQPVYYDSTKHYLIVTAWGTEASDELDFNVKNN